MKIDIVEILRKKKVLDQAAKNLKDKFVGIDDIIDTLMQNISA